MRKLKIQEDEEFQEGNIVESWSKKRIFAGLFILGIIGMVGWYGLKQVSSKTSQVLGSSTVLNQARSVSDSDVRLPSKEDANMLLEQAKKELNALTLEKSDTSSQAALQKIIADLQSIQKGKDSPMDLICHTVCGK